ncbi:MAG TPA: hypothetical protein VFY71_10730 [Planctomycetota bacterium]|nr:hypothetical protein [Planctomycetota bacterium]
MDFLSQLWMPIVVAAVLVFLVSSVIHMALPVHKGDKQPLPNEARVADALRGTPAGEYMMPACGSMKDMGSPEMLAKYQQGPIALVTLMPTGVPKIGKALVNWFLFSLIVGAITGYVAWHALPPGSSYLHVFQITGAVAWMAYGIGEMPNSIWKGTPSKTTFKFVIDGLAYALVTAGAFGWLWPR